MKRREFFRLFGGAIGLPMAARAQQAPLPVIGFLHSASSEPNAKRLAGFHRGLQQSGFIAGQNVAIEYRWAGGQNVRLPELAMELVRKPVTVIATLSSTPATLAAKAATATIPIFFLIAEDRSSLDLSRASTGPAATSQASAARTPNFSPSVSDYCMSCRRKRLPSPYCSTIKIQMRSRRRQHCKKQLPHLA
jgi:ABC-type uncharacterized transport system substrate-binding protein